MDARAPTTRVEDALPAPPGGQGVSSQPHPWMIRNDEAVQKRRLPEDLPDFYEPRFRFEDTLKTLRAPAIDTNVSEFRWLRRAAA